MAGNASRCTHDGTRAGRVGRAITSATAAAVTAVSVHASISMYSTVTADSSTSRPPSSHLSCASSSELS